MQLTGPEQKEKCNPSTYEKALWSWQGSAGRGIAERWEMGAVPGTHSATTVSFSSQQLQGVERKGGFPSVEQEWGYIRAWLWGSYTFTKPEVGS